MTKTFLGFVFTIPSPTFWARSPCFILLSYLCASLWEPEPCPDDLTLYRDQTNAGWGLKWWNGGSGRGSDLPEVGHWGSDSSGFQQHICSWKGFKETIHCPALLLLLWGITGSWQHGGVTDCCVRPRVSAKAGLGSAGKGGEREWIHVF